VSKFAGVAISALAPSKARRLTEEGDDGHLAPLRYVLGQSSHERQTSLSVACLPESNDS